MITEFELDAKGLLNAAKWAFTVRRVVRSDGRRLAHNVEDGVAGDLVLARVTAIGQHQNVQLAEGRPSKLYVGDLIVLACGARYAPDQFHAEARLSREGAQMVAGGGICGAAVAANDRMKPPTRVQPLGLVCRADGTPINVADYAIENAQGRAKLNVIGVLGTSMNSGKTTATANLAHGLGRAGYRVAAIKATGTGAFGDYNAYLDAGAHCVLDFTDAGMASTYQQPLQRIERGYHALLTEAEARGCDIAVVEFADGILQEETRQIVQWASVRATLIGTVFTATDALSAVAGISWARSRELAPLAVSGMITLSPLAQREAEPSVGVPILSASELCDPLIASRLLVGLQQEQEDAA